MKAYNSNIISDNNRFMCGLDMNCNETIHSGQFMLSKYDEDSDNEENNNRHDNSSVRVQPGYNFESSLADKNYAFADSKIEIDESLQKMFKYLSIAMSGKITNPKWNSFKGVKFGSRDKIRLNNIIWREYHMQFVKKLIPVVVQFASPISESPQVHGNVVLEGKYWKRRQDIIVLQYKKWRQFFKQQQQHQHGWEQSEEHGYPPSSSGDGAPVGGSGMTGTAASDVAMETGLFDRIHVQRTGTRGVNCTSRSPPPNLSEVFMEWDDELFPLVGPRDHRDHDDDGDFDFDFQSMEGMLHNCQVIQPHLNNLQPRMDSKLDFLNDFLCQPEHALRYQRHFSSESSLPSHHSVSTEPHQMHMPPSMSSRPHYQMTQQQPQYPPMSASPFRSSVPSATQRPSYSTYKQRPPHNVSHSSRNQSPGQSPLCKTPNLLSILLQPLSAAQSSSSPFSSVQTTSSGSVTFVNTGGTNIRTNLVKVTSRNSPPFPPLAPHQLHLQHQQPPYRSDLAQQPPQHSSSQLSRSKSGPSSTIQHTLAVHPRRKPPSVPYPPQSSKQTTHSLPTYRAPEQSRIPLGAGRNKVPSQQTEMETSDCSISNIVSTTASLTSSSGQYGTSQSAATSSGIGSRFSLSTNNLVQSHLDDLARLLVQHQSKQQHGKMSKAALLRKAADTVKRLRDDKYRLQTEIGTLQAEIDALQTRFSVFCSQLPATGVCVNGSRLIEGRHWFEEFVIKQSSANWKFYIFCMIFDSLFSSYNNSVCTNSMESLAHSVASWLEKECSLMKLRHIIMNGMRNLSRRTSIVSDPHRMPEDVRKLVGSSNQNNQFQQQ